MQFPFLNFLKLKTDKKFLSILSMCRDEVNGICLFVLLLNDTKFASLLKNYGFCLEWFHIVILA